MQRPSVPKIQTTGYDCNPGRGLSETGDSHGQNGSLRGGTHRGTLLMVVLFQ
jgi:hypothetical protein